MYNCEICGKELDYKHKVINCPVRGLSGNIFNEHLDLCIDCANKVVNIEQYELVVGNAHYLKHRIIKNIKKDVSVRNRNKRKRLAEYLKMIRNNFEK